MTDKEAMNPAAVVIAGAGPVGLATAIALAQAGVPVRVYDARERARAAAAPRALALSHGSRLILERLDLWRALAATPITRIEVSQQGGFGRARIDAGEQRVDALGHVVRLGAVTAAFTEAALARSIPVAFGCKVESSANAGGGLRVRTGDVECDAALLVHAEGTPTARAAAV